MNIVDRIHEEKISILRENRTPKFLYIGREEYLELKRCINELLRLECDFSSTYEEKEMFDSLEIVRVFKYNYFHVCS